MVEQFNLSALVALAGHKSSGQQIGLHLAVTALLPAILATRNLHSVLTAAKLAAVALGAAVQHFGPFAAGALSDHFVSEVLLACQVQRLVRVTNYQCQSWMLH